MVTSLERESQVLSEGHVEGEGAGGQGGRPLPHMAPPLQHLLTEPWERQSQQEHLQLDAYGQSHRLLQVHP